MTEQELRQELALVLEKAKTNPAAQGILAKYAAAQHSRVGRGRIEIDLVRGADGVWRIG